MKEILYYGLQRSGTNLLESYLIQNFKIKIINNNLERSSTLHKHFRLYDDKLFIPEPQFYNELEFKTFKEYEKSFDLNLQAKAIIIITKDPYSWYLSYLNWAKKCNWPTPKYHYIEEYNRFHEKWIQFAKEDERISIINYINLIENPKRELMNLKVKHGLDLKFSKRIFGINNSIAKVDQSEMFTDKNLSFYLQKEYLKKFGRKEIEVINTMLNTTVLCELGYELESPV
jgi:hypothetical protein